MINKSQIIKSTILNGGETETVILHRGMYYEVGWGRVSLYVMHDYGVPIAGFSINLTNSFYPIPFDDLEEAMDFLAENWWTHEHPEIIDVHVSEEFGCCSIDIHDSKFDRDFCY